MNNPDIVRKQVVLDWLEDLPEDATRDYVIGTFCEQFDFWPEEIADVVSGGTGSLMVRNSDPSTSRQAAKDNYPRSGSQRWKVLMAVAKFSYDGGSGAIADEIEEETGILYRSVTPRIGELRRAKLIQSSGSSRAGNLGSMQDVIVLTALGWSTIREREGIA